MLRLENRRPGGAGLALALGLSVITHALLLVFVVPRVIESDPHELSDPLESRAQSDADAQLQNDMRVVVRTLDEIEPEPEPEEQDELEQEPEEEPEPEQEPEPEEEEEEPKESVQIDRKIVEQETNQDRPTEADYLSQQDNKTDEQTRATETTTAEVAPGEPTPPDQLKEDAGGPETEPERSDAREDPAQPAQPGEELAMASREQPDTSPVQEPPPEPEPAPQAPEQTEDDPTERPTSEDGAFEERVVTPDSPVVKGPRREAKERRPQPDPKQIFGQPGLADYEEVFGAEQPVEDPHDPGNKRRRLFANHAERQKRLTGSLENMITEIQPGNHTSVNAHRSVYAGYIGSIHRRIHPRWAGSYLRMLDTQYPQSDPLQDPNLKTVLEFVIDARSGEFEKVNVVRSSGELAFDAEAIDTAWSVGPRPNPPPQIVSPNGNVYIHWSFWRDGRQCGVFGAAIYLLDADGTARKAPAGR